MSALSQNRDYARLWWAAASSNFGSMLHAVALPLTAIMLLEATPADLAALGAAGLIPGVVLGVATGSWIDRLRRRPILIASDWARAAVVASIPLAAAFDALTLAQLYAASLLLGFFNFAFGVAHHSYLPSLVEREQLVEANGQLKVAEAVTEGGAFALGGWLIQWLTAPIVLALDGISFGVSALFLAGIRRAEPAPEREAGARNLWREVGEGLRLVASTPLLRVMALADALAAFAFRVVFVVYMLFVYDELGFSTGLLGVVFAVGSLSSFVGALWTDRIASRLGLGPSMILGFGITGASMLLLPFAPAATLTGVVLLLLHQMGDGGAILYEVSEVSARQALTPPELLGRVNASLRTLGSFAMLLGAAAGGVLGETIGLRGTLAVGGGVAVAATPLLLASPIRRLRAIPVRLDLASER